MTRPSSYTSFYIFAFFIASALVLTNIFFYFYNWGGDPEIHIIFARNFLNGYPLQFNPGEYTSGETSPLYALLVSALLYLFPDTIIPYLMKIIGFFSMLFISYQLYRHARALGFELPIAILPALIWLTYPFVVFQAALGMENMLFATFVVVLVRYVLERTYSVYHKETAVFAAIAVLVLFFLRPESVFVGLSLGLVFLSKKQWLNSAILLASPLTIIIILWFIEQETGAPLHGAGRVRALLSAANAMQWSLLGIDGSISFEPLRIILYIYFVVAFILIGTIINDEHKHDFQGNQIRVYFFVGTVLIPLILHMFCVLPLVHFSRLTLYVVAVWLLVTLPWFLTGLKLTMVKLIQKYERKRTQKIAGLFNPAMCIVVALVCFGHFSLENYARYRSGHMWFQKVREAKIVDDLSASIEAAHSSMTRALRPGFAKRFSDQLCKEITCADGDKTVVALQEVQLRLRLDERFTVRSLDGIVDYRIQQFWEEDGIDMIKYVKERRVDYLLAFPGYGQRVEELGKLEPGDEAVLEGARFQIIESETLGRKIAKITSSDEAAEGATW